MRRGWLPPVWLGLVNTALGSNGRSDHRKVVPIWSVQFLSHIGCSFPQLISGLKNRNQSGDQEALQTVPVWDLCEASLQGAEAAQTHETWKCEAWQNNHTSHNTFKWIIFLNHELNYMMCSCVIQVIGLLDVFTADLSLDRFHDL